MGNEYGDPDEAWENEPPGDRAIASKFERR